MFAFLEEMSFWEGTLRRIDWMKGWIALCVVVLLSGCATRRDVVILDRETNRLQGQLHSQQKERESLQKDIERLQKEFAVLQKETNDLKSSVTVESKKGQADLLLQLETLQTEVKTLATGMEEYKELLKKPPKEMEHLRANIVLQTKALEDREKMLEEKDKVLEVRIRALEERLKGLEEKIDQLGSRQLELEGAIPAKEVVSDVKGISTRAGDLYKDAYETLQKGSVEAARRKFEAFLKQYPNTDLSDNAQFWIGETYYVKKDFEKAILEYEKAITKYPEGDKIPAALFKQAFAFLELGDKTNGRNLLKRVIERYPNSEQAQMAKKRLETLK